MELVSLFISSFILYVSSLACLHFFFCWVYNCKQVLWLCHPNHILKLFLFSDQIFVRSVVWIVKFNGVVGGLYSETVVTTNQTVNEFVSKVR